MIQNFDYKIIILFSVFVILKFNSCVPDPDLGDPQTELIITFDSGPLKNREFNLVTSGSVEVLNFYPNANQSKAYVDQFESVDGRTLKSVSSVNFAWQGPDVKGTYKTFNFSNPSSPNTGDIELDFTDGEFVNAPIPSNIDINVFNYQVIDETVTGSINFTTRVYYVVNGKDQSFNSNCTITFGIVRGPDR